MRVNRRTFVSILSASAVPLARPLRSVAWAEKLQARALALDGFVIFDPRLIAAHAEQLFPGKGAELMNLWRTRQFEYTWLRTLGRRYKSFWSVTEDALLYAARSLRLDLAPDQRDRLMDAWHKLPVWPDVPAALAELRRRGVRLAFLSNFSAGMLDGNLAQSNLQDLFEPHLTTDRVRAFKPSPQAYQMAVDAFRLPRHEIAFAAHAAWDAAGATWFGYPTVWVNRTQADREALDASPHAVVPDLRAMVRLLQG